MNLSIIAVETCADIPECMMMEEIRYAMQEDDYLASLTASMINVWLLTRAEAKEEIWL